MSRWSAPSANAPRVRPHPELAPRPPAPPDTKDRWFIREGPVEDHFKVWPLVASVLFPCMGILLVGFDFGATAWLVGKRALLLSLEHSPRPFEYVCGRAGEGRGKG